jgi:uncharacterized SAM-binding protein YcdF (DUF218 family)
MSLNDMAAALLVPPVNLLPIGAVGLVLAWRGYRAGWLVAGLSMLGMLVLSLPLTASVLIWSLETGLPGPPPGMPPPGAIVILSAESREFMPGGVLVGDDVGPLTLERLRAGAALQRQTGLPVLVTGGVLIKGRPAVASVMARVLQRDFSVPTRWIEDRSQDTWENAGMSAEILRRAGITSVQVVTHGWHMRRALESFAHTGIAATPAPSSLETLRMDRPAMLAPSAGAWQRSFWALHEWIGLLAYSLRN